MADIGRDELISILARCVSSGKLEESYVFPVISALSEGKERPISSATLLDALRQHESEATEALVRHLRFVRHREALNVHQLRRAGKSVSDETRLFLSDLPLEAPLGWGKEQESPALIPPAVTLLRDWCFIRSHRERTPRVASLVREKFTQALARIRQAPSAWGGIDVVVLARQLRDRAGGGRPKLVEALNRLEERAEEERRGRREAAEQAFDQLPKPFPRGLDQAALLRTLEARFERAAAREEKTRLLDLACTWPTDRVAPVLAEIVQEDWAKERAALIFTLRFGEPSIKYWQAWHSRYLEPDRQSERQREEIEELMREHPGEVLLLWCSGRKDQEPTVTAELEKWCEENAKSVKPGSFMKRWDDVISPEEWHVLLGEPARAVRRREAPPAAPTAPAPAPERAPEPAEAPREPVPAPKPAEAPAEPAPARVSRAPAPAAKSDAEPERSRPVGPTLWNDHIQPFLVENWYLAAGVAMVLVGSSLVAYYTWDKHWLVRYTIMPALLGLFTFGLARTGAWIERVDAQFRGTAAVLRGAAIGLLPINFMAVALLSNDGQVTHKALAVPLMGLLYLLLFGWGLERWCAAVHAPLGWLLGGTLLFLNSLVTLGPLAQSWGDLEEVHLRFILGAGFHLGFLALAGAVVGFTRRVLTRELADQKMAPWFFGAALSVTFLQVFAWVHGSMRLLPSVHAYALMVILTGWLVLYVERRALELRGESEVHGAESFLGFALILLGVLMGSGQAHIRIWSFLLAGVVWLYQALSRRQPLHYWIALTFLVLGGASVGLLESFPGEWRPALGLALALAMSVLIRLSRRPGREELMQACIGMQVAVLVMTAVVAALAQWHYQSPPLATAACLLLVVALFVWRAFRDQRLRWVHTAAVILALTLPYFGCVDLAGRTLHGNTMVFGLAVLSGLWLGLTWLLPRPLILQARSTVLWIYGAMAVAGMALRVIIEQGTPGDLLWYRALMDHAGPLLMAAALVFATYYSRSLIPAGMAVVIVIILFPELKARYRDAFQYVGWGTGIGSATSALGLLLLCFGLRPWPFLRELGDGDRFMGQWSFPLQRRDHTLFTWPIVASVVFLATKVDTWNLSRNMFGDGVGPKTSTALVFTAVTWTLLGVYHRARRGAVLGTHLGWFWLLIGVAFGYRHAVAAPHWSMPYLITGLILQALYSVYRLLLEYPHPWVRDLLALPTRQVLRAASCVLSVVCILSILAGGDLARTGPLMLFLAAQLVWHGLVSRKLIYGSFLFALGWISLLAWTAPGETDLLMRLSIQQSLTPTLWMLLVIQVVHLALELRRGICEKLQPILLPSLMAGSLLIVLLGIAALPDAINGSPVSRPQYILLLVTVFVTARTHGCGLLALIGVLIGYLLLHFDALRGAGYTGARVELLTEPWRWGLLALVMAVFGHGGRLLYGRRPGWLVGPFASPFFRWASADWLFVPAIGFSCLAALYHTVSPELREVTAQLWAPFLGAATLALVAWSCQRGWLYGMSALLLALGNIHTVRVFLGDFLRARGLSEIHLLCLGLAASLLEASLLRIWSRKESLIIVINRASLVLAAMVLALLSANYFAHPNLATITPLRFVISGTMAYLAGLYFRRAARHPMPGEEAHVKLSEGLYHFGVAMAIWCAALLVPFLRAPATALVALGLPVAYFYLRAEMGRWSEPGIFERYRNSAATLGFIILGLYIARGVFHMVLFPETPIETDHYHHNAPLIMVLALILLRLRGLGGTDWLAFYGGLALMVGTYFTLTAIPGLSPFDDPIPAAWCAVGISHFWTVVSAKRSPLRTAIQALAAIDGETWFSLRRSWGVCLLLATQAMVLWGLMDYRSDTYMVAPLLVGAASILIHQGAIRRSPAYFVIAAIEIVVALHAGFFVPSYLAKDHVIWALLIIWAVGLIAHQIGSQRTQLGGMGTVSAILAAATMCHVLYHHPSSPVGLWAVALGALLAAATPCKTRTAQTDEGDLAAGLLPWIPTWLVYFSQASLQGQGIGAAFRAWPILSATAVLFLTGCFARHFQARLGPMYEQLTRRQPRLIDQTLSWMGSCGANIHRTVLWLAFLATAAVQVSHYGSAFEPREFGFIAVLYAAFVVAWYVEGQLRKSMAAYVILQLCVLGFFGVIRRQLMLTTSFWNYEYDVWASLAVSFCLSGTKQVFDLQPREVRVPLLGTLFALPVVAMAWVLIHNLGTNAALLVVGLHSLMFAYMGKDDRESPYHAVAVAGFVAFVLLVFWSKLELRALHAYVIPVGMGVLVLLQMFGQRLASDTRNRIRLVVLLSMLGSAGYYALIDDRYPIAFNLTLVILCLLSMGLGSFLRIRLYLVLGFAGLMVDLGSIVYKMLARMDRSAQMTIVGSLVLVIGALLVFGAIYFKTHQEALTARFDGWRRRLGEWE